MEIERLDAHGNGEPIPRPGRHRDTALFIDLENLFRGYGSALAEQLESLSISDVMAAITREGRAAGLIEQYAVKRAYADWSRWQLRLLRKEIGEQGIEPRQVFAFGQNQRQNAADVELVIDVLDLAYTRPSVTTMVIVSGDGGFGTLVRRLHESGHTVIVCSYEDRTSDALRAVADHYLELGALLAPQSGEVALVPPESSGSPADGVARAASAAGASPRRGGRVAHLQGVLEETKRLTRPSREEATAYLREAIDRLAADPTCAGWITATGIPFTELIAALRSRIDGFDDAMVGFRSPAYFLRYVLRDAACAIAAHPEVPARIVLARRNAPPPGYVVLADVGEPDVEQVYRLVLQQARLRMPSDTGELPRVLAELCTDPPRGEILQELIERLSDAVPQVPTEDVKFSVLLLRNAGLLESEEGDELTVLERRHTLPDDRAVAADLLAEITRQVREVLRSRLGEVDDIVLARLVPTAEG